MRRTNNISELLVGVRMTVVSDPHLLIAVTITNDTHCFTAADTDDSARLNVEGVHHDSSALRSEALKLRAGKVGCVGGDDIGIPQEF